MTDAAEDASPDRREQLLERIVDFVLENGITGLTLRGLAASVESNNRMLLYYFGSREELVVAALHGAERRFPSMGSIILTLDDTRVPIGDRLQAAWGIVGDPANLPFHRLFFEIFGRAGFERDRFTALLGDIGTEWVHHVAAAFVHAGVPDARADVFAHELVALWRGLQAALLSGAEPEIVDRAARDATAALTKRLSC